MPSIPREQDQEHPDRPRSRQGRLQEQRDLDEPLPRIRHNAPLRREREQVIQLDGQLRDAPRIVARGIRLNPITDAFETTQNALFRFCLQNPQLATKINILSVDGRTRVIWQIMTENIYYGN